MGTLSTPPYISDDSPFLIPRSIDPTGPGGGGKIHGVSLESVQNYTPSYETRAPNVLSLLGLRFTASVPYNIVQIFENEFLIENSKSQSNFNADFLFKLESDFSKIRISNFGRIGCCIFIKFWPRSKTVSFGNFCSTGNEDDAVEFLRKCHVHSKLPAATAPRRQNPRNQFESDPNPGWARRRAIVNLLRDGRTLFEWVAWPGANIDLSTKEGSLSNCCEIMPASMGLVATWVGRQKWFANSNAAPLSRTQTLLQTMGNNYRHQNGPTL